VNVLTRDHVDDQAQEPAASALLALTSRWKGVILPQVPSYASISCATRYHSCYILDCHLKSGPAKNIAISHAQKRNRDICITEEASILRLKIGKSQFGSHLAR
jgi:hypothetical protein